MDTIYCVVIASHGRTVIVSYAGRVPVASAGRTYVEGERIGVVGTRARRDLGA